MMEYMSKVAEVSSASPDNSELGVEERNLLSVAYKTSSAHAARLGAS